MSKAISKAAPLKLEIRLAQAISESERDLTDIQKDDLRGQKELQQKCPDMTDIMRFTTQIDRSLSSHGIRQVYGPRLTNFLDGVQKVVSLGDLLIGGLQGMIGRGVWFAVRISLLVSIHKTRDLMVD